MASELAHPEAIKPSLLNDAPTVNGDHDMDHDMENGQHNHDQNASAVVENGAISKTDTALDINNITADPNPAGPTPIEDVAPGIAPISDFMPKDAPTSHPTPPPDEPLAASEVNVDTEMHAVEEVPKVESGPELVAPVAPPAPTEPSLVRPREDDDEDEEPAPKRNKLQDVPMPDAEPVVEKIDAAQPESERAAESHEAAQPESSDQAAAPVTASSDVAKDAPPVSASPTDAATGAPIANVPVVSTESGEPVDAKPVASAANPEVPDAKPEVSEAKSVDAPDSSKAVETAPPKHQYSKDPMTQSQMKFLLEKMKNLKKTKNSVPFLNPVDHVALGIPTYPEVVKNPMDLNTMESKLKSNKYSSVQEFADDFDLIVGNTRKFNGDHHAVTQAGFSMEAYFRKMMETVPSATQAAAPKPQPKKASPKPAAPAARRESRSVNHVPGMPAQAPVAVAADAFALQPDGTPQIRRDSTINRPARTIKAPARELAYAKPKRKEHQLELKFCEHILEELRSPKYSQVNQVFLTPVDPVALNIPHYRQIVKNPMDLSTMAQKLKQGQYGKASEFKKDFELMIQNCLAFNPAGNVVRDLGIQFKRHFDSLWHEKEKWEKKRKAETQRATSASADEESADDEEEEEEEEAHDDPAGTIRALQKQLADMQNALAGLNNPQKRPKKPKAAKPPAKKAERSHAAPKTKAAPVKTKAPKKVRQVTYEEKQEISEAVNKMDEVQVQELTRIITENCQKYRDQEEMELEIDDLPNDVQSMLLKYVRSLFGNPKKGRAASPDDAAAMDDDDFEPERVARRGGGGGGAASKKKKHKPMGKDQQTAAIESIQKKLAQFTDAGVSAGQSPAGSHNYAMADDTSGDDESEESEEE